MSGKLPHKLKKSGALFLIATIIFATSFTVLPPQKAHAQIVRSLSSLTSCFGASGLLTSVSGLLNDFLGGFNITNIQDIFEGNLGNIGDIISPIIGGIPGFGGNQVPVLDATTHSRLDRLIDQTNVQISQGNTRINQLGSLVTKEYIIDCTIWAIGKGILEQLTKNFLGWINTGFGRLTSLAGNLFDAPFYIQDPTEFFSTLEDGTTLVFLESLNGVVNNDVLQVLANSRQRIGSDSGLFTCPAPITDIATIFQDFPPELAWQYYSIAISNPQCTSIGQLALANDELDRQIASAQGEYDFLLNSHGYLPEVTEGSVVSPASVLSEQTNKIVQTGIDTLLQTDEISELIGALIDWFSQELFGDGPGGLREFEGLGGLG